jgi:hypothetical protein
MNDKTTSVNGKVIGFVMANSPGVRTTVGTVWLPRSASGLELYKFAKQAQAENREVTIALTPNPKDPGRPFRDLVMDSIDESAFTPVTVPELSGADF